MIGEPLRERMRSLERRELIGLLVVGALVVAGGSLWYVRSLPRPVTVEMSGARGEAAAVEGSASPSPSPTVIVVHVAGWVHRPGVYQLRQGDRFIDAIRRAGGPRPRADLTSLNLAAMLADGQQIVVLRKGQRLGPIGGPSGASGSASSGSGGTEAIVNLNTATLEQLETLPGIGPVLAQRIIDHREAHGPFGSVEDLLEVSGIGEKRLADLKPKVTV